MDAYSVLSHCLCPAGNGVFTVQTAKEKKQQLHQQLYGHTEPDQVLAPWQQQLQQGLQQDQPFLLGVCSDTGGGIMRGANWGPLFIRQALYSQLPPGSVCDLGDVRVIPHLLHDKYLNEATLRHCRQALYDDPDSVLPVSPLSITERSLQALYGQRPTAQVLALGGDHSVSYPLTKAYIESRQAQGKRVAIIHFDAHTDLLENRLGVDLCFATWTYHILELLEKPSHLIQLGIRSSGKDKAFWESQHGITQHWASDLQRHGVEPLCQQSIDALKADGIDEIYITFDIDAIDANFVSATGTPEPDGLTPEQAYRAIALFCEAFPLGGADIVEVAPFISPAHAGSQSAEPDNTLAIAAELSQRFITALRR